MDPARSGRARCSAARRFWARGPVRGSGRRCPLRAPWRTSTSSRGTGP